MTRPAKFYTHVTRDLYERHLDRERRVKDRWIERHAALQKRVTVLEERSLALEASYNHLLAQMQSAPPLPVSKR